MEDKIDTLLDQITAMESDVAEFKATEVVPDVLSGMTASKGFPAFAIITEADETTLKYTPELDVKDGRIKDPVKLAEKKVEKERKQKEDAKYDPLFSRIVGYAISDYTGNVKIQYPNEKDADPKVVVDKAERDRAERKLISSLIKDIGEVYDMSFGGGNIATYNGDVYDVPFVERRAVILGIDTHGEKMNLTTLKYFNRDLLKEWSSYNKYKTETLYTMCDVFFGIGQVCEDNWDKVTQLKNRVVLTSNLFEKIDPIIKH